MLSEDMDQVLKDYYHWSFINSPDDIDYPHCNTISRPRGSVVSSVGISDDEAQWIDSALGYLKLDSPESYNVIRRVYRDGKTIRWLASKGEGDRRTIARTLAEGKEFVRGVLRGASLGI